MLFHGLFIDHLKVQKRQGWTADFIPKLFYYLRGETRGQEGQQGGKREEEGKGKKDQIKG